MAPRERSEEVWAWYSAVYEAVQEIPYGRVTSYGHIARLVGKPERSRQVGICLKHLPSQSTDPDKPSPQWHSGNVPWQRVINSRGAISPRGPGAASRQAEVLESEGVEVERDSMGEYTVDLRKYGWFPDILPTEAGENQSSEENEEDEES